MNQTLNGEKATTQAGRRGALKLMASVAAVSALPSIAMAQGAGKFNLKIAITPISVGATWDYAKEWLDLGTTIFGTVPFALYSANTANIDTKLAIKDTSAMLSYYAKIANTDAALRTKFNSSDTIKYTKIYYTDSALLTKMNHFDTSRYAKQLGIDTMLRFKLNSKVILAEPYLAVDEISFSPAMPKTSFSMTSMTSLSIISGDAPSNPTRILTTGKSKSGN